MSSTRRRGRPKKRGVQGGQNNRGASVSNDTSQDEIWTCKICKVNFTSENDKLILCDRCQLPHCISCLGMSVQRYELLTSEDDDTHWYCKDCKSAAIHAVRDDFEIEERCEQYFKKVEARFQKIEQDITLKADKTTVDSMGVDVLALQDKLKKANKDIVSLHKEIDLVRNEQDERERRKCNIVVHGLPEGENIDDYDIAVELLGAIDINDIPRKVVRMGQAFDDPAVKGRPMRIILSNPENRKECVKNGPKVRDATGVSFNPKTVFVNPDMTELERRDQKKLREELAPKRLTDKDYIIRGNRVVKRDPQPSQRGAFRGRGRGSPPSSPPRLTRFQGRGGGPSRTPPRGSGPGFPGGPQMHSPNHPNPNLETSLNLSPTYPSASQLHDRRLTMQSPNNMATSDPTAAGGEQERHM